MQYVGQRAMYDLRMQIFAHVQQLDLKFFDKNPVGRILTRITSDVQTLNEMFTAGVIEIFGDIFMLVGIIIAMLIINWQLALVVFSVLPLIVLTTFLFRKKVRKSFHTPNAAQDLFQHQELFRNKTKIVLFQNGWGNTDIFSSFFDTEQIYNARVITGFQRQKKNEVTITVHADPVHIGNLFGKDSSPIKQLCESITMGDLPCEPADSIEKDLWAKMLYNCLLNPLSAILCVPYGKLAEHQFTRDVMKGITEEIFEVMAAAGYETHWKTPADFLGVFYDKLIPPTADHRSSMLQDILAGKKTEIDALNGAIIALGKKHAIDVSFNLIVYNLVKFIESERHRK